MEVELEDLRSNPLLASLKPGTLSKLADSAEYASFGQGMGIVAGMDSGDEIYLILEGQAQVQIALEEHGHPGDTVRYEPGDLVAGIRFFGEPYPADGVIANIDIRALRWNVSDLHSICEADPESGYRLAIGLGKLVIQGVRQISSNKNL